MYAYQDTSNIGGAFLGTDQFGNPIYGTAPIGGAHQPATLDTAHATSSVPMLTRSQAVTSPVSSPTVVSPTTATLAPSSSTSSTNTASSSTLPAGYSVDANGNVYAPTQTSGYSAPSSSGATVDTSASDTRLLDAMVKLFSGSASVGQSLAPQLYAPDSPAAPADSTGSGSSSKGVIALAVLAVIGVAFYLWRRAHQA